MNWRIAASSALLFGALATGVGAQDVQPEPLSRLDVRYRVQIEALIDSARLKGLPWSAVRSKALEGINKKYDSPKIVAVVRQYYASLVKSREVLGPLVPADIEAGASVLIAGVHAEDLALFRPTTAGRSPALALIYLGDLISARHGVPTADAVAAFAKLWKDGAGDSDFDGLWRGIDQDILSGVSPKAALLNRARSIKPPADQDQENPRS